MSEPFSITFRDVEAAARRIEGHVLRTPLVAAPRLSELTGATVLVKHENMQATASFKERGAVNKLLTLTRTRPRAASSPCRPATTPRRSPITRAASAFRRRS
jgi:threonine dehydratase